MFFLCFWYMQHNCCLEDFAFLAGVLSFGLGTSCLIWWWSWSQEGRAEVDTIMKDIEILSLLLQCWSWLGWRFCCRRRFDSFLKGFDYLVAVWSLVEVPELVLLHLWFQLSPSWGHPRHSLEIFQDQCSPFCFWACFELEHECGPVASLANWYICYMLGSDYEFLVLERYHLHSDFGCPRFMPKPSSSRACEDLYLPLTASSCSGWAHFASQACLVDHYDEG